MILDLVTGFSRSTSRSDSKCRGGQFCCNYFQKISAAQRKDVKAELMLTTEAYFDFNEAGPVRHLNLSPLVRVTGWALRKL